MEVDAYSEEAADGKGAAARGISSLCTRRERGRKTSPLGLGKLSVM